jgi:deoxyribonuclease-4
MSMRVRTILSSLDAKSKKPFMKLLPEISIPEECLLPVKYPSALLGVFPKEESYCLLGVVSERMLRYPVDEINMETLVKEVYFVYEDSTTLQTDKIRKSKTTIPYIERLQETRKKMNTILKGSLEFDTVLRYKSVEGHPDGQTASQLFEVKMTGKLEKEWKNFLLQSYSYGALEPKATELYLVLPLHGQIVDLKLEQWKVEKRMKWCELLQTQTMSEKNPKNDIQLGLVLQQRFNIGMHVQKKPSLATTLLELNETQPFQIFLGNPSSTNLQISDDKLVEASNVMGYKRVYIHTPYIINLCKDGERDEVFVKNIEYSKTIGSKGVVVHVGKSTTKSLPEAMENMRKTIIDAMTFATPECPILLETPAGQGTETLTDCDEFLGFVMSFGDLRLGVCVDTCHVFTNGHDPLDYLQRAHKTGLLRLVHFNDSASTCGACVDRHAYIGTGHIGIEKMEKIATFCSLIGVDMVVE